MWYESSNMADTLTSPLSYEDAGVDIDAGNKFVSSIRDEVRNTRRKGVIDNFGGFGGLFDLKAEGWRDPVLVSGTDGVGTKLLVANAVGKHDTIGTDLVAMCVNDILTHGAEPLFFLDYFATGKLDPSVAEQIVMGIAEACRNAGCALIGGETAEMPGMYGSGHYDLAGFSVGAVERTNLLPNTHKMQEGDVLVGLQSSGPHSNGYSLIRKVVELSGLSYQDSAPFSDTTLGQSLLAPTRIYVNSVLPLVGQGLVKGLAHITGGGLKENVERVCPEGISPIINYDVWEPQAVFDWIADTGNISGEEMHRTFNMGIGFVLIVSAENHELVVKQLQDLNETPYLVGVLEST